MSFMIANSKPVRIGLTLGLLAAVTFCLRPLEQRLAGPGGGRGTHLAGLAGHGGVLAVLGGMRAAVASGFWLRANVAWEQRNAAATAALIQLTVAADERPVYFWLNGARMLAYDLPEWQLTGPVPAALRRGVNAEHAQRAIIFLEKGRQWHGGDAVFPIEMGNIHLRRTGDLDAAAHYYRQAAVQPGAPYFAARIYAELLRKLGRSREALDWLRQILPGLPPTDPAAGRIVVLARIQALEQELAAP